MSVVFKGKTYYRTAEACRTTGISKNTFLRWVKQGTLPDVPARDGRNWRLFTTEDVAILRVEVSRIDAPRVRSKKAMAKTLAISRNTVRKRSSAISPPITHLGRLA